MFLFILYAEDLSVLPIPALQGQKRFPYMMDCQALIFDKRINYYTDKEKKQVGGSKGAISLILKERANRLLEEEYDEDDNSDDFDELLRKASVCFQHKF